MRPLSRDVTPILMLALPFFAVYTTVSCARWANFEYRTFDLAYYVQALWQLVHGRFQVSVLGVPLLGNHVEPIVFVFAPLFLLFSHPLLLVIAQNAALASMGPVAFRIGRRLGLDRRAALFLGGAILLTPATGYVALHEFHPEAFAAPFLLLMIDARLRQSLRAHWGWLIAVLACKENMALLLVAYCGVNAFLERRRPLRQLSLWYLWPMAISILWFLICAKLITPALNSGNIDYLVLYNRLGSSPGDILLKMITQPNRISGALFHSVTSGNLIWATLLPFLAVPIIRPAWLLISTPILLQHLLSWRSSEWTIYFHYAAPLLPLYWVALAEGILKINRSKHIPGLFRHSLPVLTFVACVVAQIFLGPLGSIATTTSNWIGGQQERALKKASISRISPDASVVAPLPYLSHLAMRENLYSLHYVLKGLQTLSHSTYSPPSPPDFVLIDYGDFATFDAMAGYYHPAMKTAGGRVIPSSDRLLHEFLRQRTWTIYASNEITLFRRGKSETVVEPSIFGSGGTVEIGKGTTLTGITKSAELLEGKGIEISTNWTFEEPRGVFPWMFLKLTSRGHKGEILISRGLCAPEATNGTYQERWRVVPTDQIVGGDYEVEALLVDRSKSGIAGPRPPLLCPPIPLGELRVPFERGNPVQLLK